MGDLFDAAAMYDEDYLYFFAAPGTASEFAAHGPEVPGAGVPADEAAELAWRLAGLRPGLSVLDLACGHRQLTFAKRIFAFLELRDWLLAAGFTTVTGYGEDGRTLTADHKRMIIVAGLA